MYLFLVPRALVIPLLLYFNILENPPTAPWSNLIKDWEGRSLWLKIFVVTLILAELGEQGTGTKENFLWQTEKKIDETSAKEEGMDG